MYIICVYIYICINMKLDTIPKCSHVYHVYISSIIMHYRLSSRRQNRTSSRRQLLRLRSRRGVDGGRRRLWRRCLYRLGGGGGLEGLRHRRRLELGDVVAERRAVVGGFRRHLRLALVHLDEDGRGRGDGDEDEPRGDGGRVLGALRRRARRAGADGALGHVHHRLSQE